MAEIKVVQEGTSVTQAADYQTVLSTDWPTMNVLYSGAFNISWPTASPVPITIFEHDLGYTPVFMILRSDTRGRATTGVDNTDLDNNPQFYTMDSRKLYYDPSASPAGATKGYYYIFDRDVTAKVTSVPGFPTPQASGGTDFGLEVASPNKNVSSPDDRDTSATTKHHSLVVQVQDSAVPQATLPTQLSIFHGLGYYPSYLIYNDFKDRTPPTIQFAPTRTQGDLTTLRLRGVQSLLGGRVYYVIFKDPIAGTV